MEIKDQQILITGANRGIGRAVALMCAESKGHLHLVNRTVDPELEPLLKKAGALSVTQYQVDLGSNAALEAFLSKYGGLELDILINNSGQLTGGLLEDQNMDEIDSLLQVNVRALIRLTKAFLPGMIQRKKGKIINQASVMAYMALPCASVYAASKAAVAAFTQCLEGELSGTGVTTLLLITPGVETRMFSDIPKHYGSHFKLSFIKSLPSKEYAKRVREAILEDLTELRPPGATGMGLVLAQHAPWAFRSLAKRAFHR